jgi:hypothetical protein
MPEDCMFRPTTTGRWALLCLALAAVASPALAQPKKKAKKKTPVSVCAHFDQIDKDDDGVELVVANRCEIKLACSVSWTLTCAPDTPKASRSQHASAFPLEVGNDQSTLASPSDCGNDGWVLDVVTWSCTPEPRPKTARK